MKVIFMGTPDFAVPTLEALVESEHEVLAVITQPDREKDKKGNLLPTPVKVAAQKAGLNIEQFASLKKDGVEFIRSLSPDIIVTVAYGQIISQEILDIPRFGVVNVHASLLPKYRGSSPIQWAVINGEKETGVTIMRTVFALDAGDIILVKKTEIHDGETAGELFDRLKLIGRDALMQALGQIEAGTASYTSQDESKATKCRMLKKEDGIIDWTLSAESIVNRVRGLNPWPVCYSYLPDESMFKIYKAKALDVNKAGAAGEVIACGKKEGFVIACGKGAVSVELLQLSGKKIMDALSFLNGCRIGVGTILGQQG